MGEEEREDRFIPTEETFLPVSDLLVFVATSAKEKECCCCYGFLPKSSRDIASFEERVSPLRRSYA